jgi:hypothetical protein
MDKTLQLSQNLSPDKHEKLKGSQWHNKTSEPGEILVVLLFLSSHNQKIFVGDHLEYLYERLPGLV